MSQGKEYTTEQKEEIIQSLREYLELGYSRNKACAFIGFKPTTLSNWVVNDEALGIKLQGYENHINVKARANIKKAVKDGDKEQSKWWLERREKKDFSTRSEITGQDGEALPILVKFLDDKKDE